MNRLELITSHITPSTIGVELGVCRGEFSHQILSSSSPRLWFAVDRWAGDAGHDATQHLSARQLLLPHLNCSIIPTHFSHLPSLFLPNTFDIIYIDGYAHTGQDSGLTLSLAYPLLKPGGLFAGHDYSPRYPLTIHHVDAFAHQISKPISLTTEPELPSWYLYK